ncbi:transposase, partial [Nocardia sp. GAS34]
MSMSGVLAYRPDRSEAAFVFAMKEGAYNTESLIEFRTELRDHFAGDRVTVIWDGLSAHRYRAMKAWIATQRHWLRVEQLPSYAYGLNPIEQVWGNLRPVISISRSGESGHWHRRAGTATNVWRSWTPVQLWGALLL